ncbi:MAG: rhodanese-like domain-containing protein [Deltaproteobacteria bacterium]|nr:rhodanese-like domain-containing protein [Deltaproteobacteria bacterium]
MSTHRHTDPNSAAPSPSKGLPDSDPALARRLVRDEGAVLLDVRKPNEFAEGHVEGAVSIPHDHVAARIPEIIALANGDQTKPIVVYCRAGGRAGIAKQALLDAGFVNVSNLGGVADWRDG